MHIVIVGNGIAGVTAARFVRKRSDHRITIISGESDFHYARTALMYIYMGDLRYEDTKPYADDFWRKNRIELIREHAVRADTEARVLHLASGEHVPYDRLLLATGSRPNRFGWPGEHAPGVQGLYGLEDLARMEAATKDCRSAVVVGGGLIGVEMAEMLCSRGIEVDFVVREAHYMDYLLGDAEAALVEAAIRTHGVRLHLGVEIEEILTDPASGQARGVRLKDSRELEAGFVGLAVGVGPRIDLAEASQIDTDRGILVDRAFRTSAEGVFAVGDCAQFRDPPPGRKPIEQLWYTGRSHGRQVASGLLGDPQDYEPPLFFNSAKFFDLEYQTYGTIGPAPAAGDDEASFSDGASSIRIAFRNRDRAVLGVNALGVRLRHNVWSHWIRSGARLDDVLGDFGRGLFDPEFTRTLEVAA